MIHAYAVENQTQRGATSLSIAGSVAAALRLCLQEEFSTPEIRRRNTGRDRDGIGARAILEKLKDVRGIRRNVVDDQLANLKASGHYDRIEHEEIAKYEAAQEAELQRIATAEIAEQEAEQQRIAAEARAAERAAEAERRRQEIAAARAAKQAAREEAQRRAAAVREEAARRREEEAETRRQQADELAQRRAAEAAEAARLAEEARAARPQAETNRNNATQRTERVNARERAQPPAFDMTGVGRIFTTPSHLDTFREIVTTPTVARVLPFNLQAGIAAAILQRYRDNPPVRTGGRREMTAEYVENTLREILSGPLMLQHIADAAERRRLAEELARESWTSKWHRAEANTARFAAGARKSAETMETLSRQRPAGIELALSPAFLSAKAHLRRAKHIVDSFTEPTIVENIPIERDARDDDVRRLTH